MRAGGARPRRLSRAVPAADRVALVRRARGRVLRCGAASTTRMLLSPPCGSCRRTRRRSRAAETYRTRRRSRHTSGTTRQAYALEYRNSAVAKQRRRGGKPRRRRMRASTGSSIRGDAVFARRAVHWAPDQVHHAFAAVRQHVESLQAAREVTERRVSQSASAAGARRPPAALTRRVAQVQVEHVAAAEARGNAAVTDADWRLPAAA